MGRHRHGSTAGGEIAVIVIVACPIQRTLVTPEALVRHNLVKCVVISAHITHRQLKPLPHHTRDFPTSLLVHLC